MWTIEHYIEFLNILILIDCLRKSYLVFSNTTNFFWFPFRSDIQRVFQRHGGSDHFWLASCHRCPGTGTGTPGRRGLQIQSALVHVVVCVRPFVSACDRQMGFVSCHESYNVEGHGIKFGRTGFFRFHDLKSLNLQYVYRAESVSFLRFNFYIQPGGG